MPLLQQGGTGGAARQVQHAAAAAAGHEPAAVLPGDVAITWRGDGLYFATASLDSPGAPPAWRRARCACVGLVPDQLLASIQSFRKQAPSIQLSVEYK